MDMKNYLENARSAHWMRRALAVAAIGSLGGLSACSDVLEVDLPAQLTDEALTDPAGVETQVNTIITHFQNTYNDYVWEIHGREDGGEVYLCSGGTDCGHFQYNFVFGFLDFMTARSFASSLHEKLETEWTADQVSNRARYLAIASLYEGAVFSLMGSTMCEVAIDGGPMMTPGETLAMADDRLTRALGEIGSAGDFALPFGISESAQAMAYGLRAQARWMAGDHSGAMADAQQVPQGFTAYATRDAGDPVRRNKPYYAGTFIHYGELYGVIDWWEGSANPVTGQPWPDVIPFTGYLNLGILPDGRAIRADGIPIRTAGEHRMMDEDGAVPDTRVQHMEAEIQGRRRRVIRQRQVRRGRRRYPDRELEGDVAHSRGSRGRSEGDRPGERHPGRGRVAAGDLRESSGRRGDPLHGHRGAAQIPLPRSPLLHDKAPEPGHSVVPAR